MPRPPKDVQQLARAHTESAIKTLIGIMTSKDAPASSRVQAAGTIIDRGWGKAVQPTDNKLDGKLTIEVVQTFGADCGDG